MIVVEFVRNHVSGSLKGLSTEGRLSFPNRGSAEDWLKGVRRHAKRNGWELGCFRVLA